MKGMVWILTGKPEDKEFISGGPSLEYNAYLNTKERWALYNLLKRSSGEFIDEVRAYIMLCYGDEFSSPYRYLDDRKIVKGNFDVFQLPEYILIRLYDAIDEKQCINLELKSGKSINHISPFRVYFDDELVTWYLYYSVKKNIEIINLNKVKDVTISEQEYYDVQLLRGNWGYGKEPLGVRVRVYDEKSSIDSAVRVLFRKNIVFEQQVQGYFEFRADVYDVNLFKRWVREMGPAVEVLEPHSLRDEMIEILKKWAQVYR